MGTWVEVNDEGAATAAGDRFSELADGISLDTPPVADFGDDDFGNDMRAQYPFDAEEQILEAKEQIREHLTKSGRGVRWAVSAVTSQDEEEGAVFTNLTPPDV